MTSHGVLRVGERQRRTRVDVSTDSDVPQPSQAALVGVRQRELGRQRLRRRRLGLVVAPPGRDTERAAGLLHYDSREAGGPL